MLAKSCSDSCLPIGTQRVITPFGAREKVGIKRDSRSLIQKYSEWQWAHLAQTVKFLCKQSASGCVIRDEGRSAADGYQRTALPAAAERRCVVSRGEEFGVGWLFYDLCVCGVARRPSMRVWVASSQLCASSISSRRHAHTLLRTGLSEVEESE